MNISAIITESESSLLRGRYWHWKKFGFLQYWWIIGGIVFALTGIVSFAFQADRTLSIFLIAFGGYCLLRKKILGWQFKKNIKTSPGTGLQYEWNITEDELIQCSSLGKTEIKWDAIYETVSTPEGFLIYFQKNQYTWIPINSIEDPDSIKALKELLTKKTNNKEIA